MSILTKIVLIGDGAVGKTSLRYSFMGEGFQTQYLMTIGADFSLKEINLQVSKESFHIKFQIWDLAGQQRFKDIRSVYFSGSAGALIVFDITRPDTFENTIYWLSEIRKYSGFGSIPVVFLGNKVDLRDYFASTITKKQGKALAKELPKYYCDKNNVFDVPYLETSAKTGENVDLAFHMLGELILKSRIKKNK
ncbi:MAG: GTP-binding protein [Candidatus Hodarchaeales archaeon]